MAQKLPKDVAVKIAIHGGATVINYFSQVAYFPDGTTSFIRSNTWESKLAKEDVKKPPKKREAFKIEKVDEVAL